MLNIKGDVVTHTSDWFDKLMELCARMIKEGKAYVDDTKQEQVCLHSGGRHHCLINVVP